MSPEATVHGTVASEALRPASPKTPAEFRSFISIAQTPRRKQKHVTMIEYRQAQLILEYSRGINKKKGSLFEGILPTHILLVQTTYVNNHTIFPSQYLSPTVLLRILFLIYFLLYLSFKMLCHLWYFSTTSRVFFFSPLWHHTYQQINWN